MKYKFYLSIIFLFFVCAVAEGQYSIWKPVAPKAIDTTFLGPGWFNIYTACDSNNIYCIIPDHDLISSYGTLIKSDGQNVTVYDSVVDYTIFSNMQVFEGYKMIIYKKELYFYNTDITYSGDTSFNVMTKLNNTGGETIINKQLNDSDRVALIIPQIADAIVFKNELYVVGSMKNIDGVVCNHIARYDGNNWHSLGIGNDEGLPLNVLSLNGNAFKIFNDKLYVLANYYDSGTFVENVFLGCWNGSKWLFKRNLPDSVRGLQHLHIIDNKLYAMHKTDTLKLFEVIDSSLIYISLNFIELVYYDDKFSELNGKLCHISKNAVNIIDVNSVSNAPQYFLPSDNTYINFMEFKNRIYAYGSFDQVNGYGDTIRYFAKADGGMTKISGHIYYDNDSNCSFGKGDENGGSELLKITPGPTYANTDQSGNYNLLLSSDTVTVEPSLKIYRKINSCSPQKYTLLANDTISHNHIDFSLGKEILVNDLAINIDGYTGWRARRGFTEWYAVNITNNGTLSDSGILRLYYSDKIQIMSSNPKADSIASTWAEWSIPAIGLNEDINIEFNAHIDTTYHNQDTLLITAQLINMNDYNTNDNYDTLQQTIVSSIDPNLIQVFPEGKDSSVNIIYPSHKQLEYLIHFENTGTDTAYNITVTDTLDGRLDASAFEIISSSHAMDYKLLPYEQINGSHIIKFNFNNILLAPTDTLLTNQTDNAGFVSYKIKLKNNLPIGTEISNRAYIYFDYNAAVETNTAIVRIDTTIANGIYNPIYYNSSEGLYYWPVPSSDKLFVMNLLKAKQQLEIYNIEGKLLLTHSLNANETSQISLENLPSGMYFLRSLTDAGKVYKFVKN